MKPTSAAVTAEGGCVTAPSLEATYPPVASTSAYSPVPSASPRVSPAVHTPVNTPVRLAPELLARPDTDPFPQGGLDDRRPDERDEDQRRGARVAQHPAGDVVRAGEHRSRRERLEHPREQERAERTRGSDDRELLAQAADRRGHPAGVDGRPTGRPPRAEPSGSAVISAGIAMHGTWKKAYALAHTR